LRFTVSLLAYVIFFVRPIYTPSNPVQELVGGSLAAVVLVLMLAVVIRGPGVLARLLAFVVLSPAAWYFSLFVYQLVYDLLHVATVTRMRRALNLLASDGR